MNFSKKIQLPTERPKEKKLKVDNDAFYGDDRDMNCVNL
jgi:hypothetical protein